VILVPSLFPTTTRRTASSASARAGRRRTATSPRPRRTSRASSGVDALGRKIRSENEMLMHLIERFQPERIISLHGTQSPGQAGVF
jgi:hypothetical protein